MPFTLRHLLADQRPAVAHQAEVIVAALTRALDGDVDYLDKGVEELVDVMKSRRVEVPDKSRELSVVDAALLPLLELHRAVYMTAPIEDQLEPSELDLLGFGVTVTDLHEAAVELGCAHLQEPTGLQPSTGLIVGVKHRVLVCRNITIRKVKRSVMFILDTGAPITFICHETVRAFGIEPDGHPSNYVRSLIEGDLSLDLYMFSPDGPHCDLNVLGMDYMMQADASLQLNGRAKSAILQCNCS